MQWSDRERNAAKGLPLILQNSACSTSHFRAGPFGGSHRASIPSWIGLFRVREWAPRDKFVPRTFWNRTTTIGFWIFSGPKVDPLIVMRQICTSPVLGSRKSHYNNRILSIFGVHQCAQATNSYMSDALVLRHGSKGAPKLSAPIPISDTSPIGVSSSNIFIRETVG